ncbi:MAG: TAT-variant-translocated molybdopterin oxidoreductase [Bacteroidia bacterium]|jgi:molybdopterin-containing oxidoreductase family iron-sulfur binding subunit
MENKNKYWRGLAELNQDPAFLAQKKNEFGEGIPLEEALTEQDGELTSNRRDFLKYFGFSVSAVALAACNKAPVKNVIPYIIKPETINPGIPNFYATTTDNGVSVLVKTREGRPIKIEGNPESPVFTGAVGAGEHASLLGLYDNDRLKSAMAGSAESDWGTVDNKVIAGLGAAKSIRLVTGSVNSPSTKKAIGAFRAKYPAAKQVTYEAASNAAIIEANKRSFGKAVVPSYRFDIAKVIVSFGADFLGTWISPLEFTRQWVKNRKPSPEKPEMSRHIQFETNLSITGSNADVRFPIKPSAEGVILVSLYNQIAKLAGAPVLSSLPNIEFPLNSIENTAKELWNAKGTALVISGSNEINNQLVVNAINSLLGNIGTTVDLDNSNNMKLADDAGFETLVNELNSGEVDAVIFYNTNPVYSYYNGQKLEAGIKKAKLSVSTSRSLDETATVCMYIAPDNHYLESWNDGEPKSGYFTLTQPTISTVFNTRQAQESLLNWSGTPGTFYDYIRENWKSVLNGQGAFETVWNKSLHDGFFMLPSKTAQSYTAAALPGELVNEVYKNYTGSKDKMELSLYSKVGIGDGTHANNPWLQELPDPISRVCWDNYAAIGKATADKLGVTDGDVINISGKGYKLESVPVLIQPGQANNTISLAIGYGRTSGGKVANNVGKNAFGFAAFNGNSFSYSTAEINVEKAAGSYELAQTQTHHTIEGRNLIREASLSEYTKDAKAGNHFDAHIISLWSEHDMKGHKWGMAIDLNACTGCGSCIVSCNVENNVPVVGRKEVIRGREMHWIRIDRYYSFKDKDGRKASMEKGMANNFLLPEGEAPIDYGKESTTDFENVKVTFQPVMCQQCGHAPCETVCPVLATVHSAEGLNHMAYNRCVGTRYCANNCPFKVRRFNWFKYRENDEFDFYMNNDLGRMVINPDVTVRSRGVMEKCSFCIQRIQAGKLQAKMENRDLKDGDIQTACSASCPSNAIVFGDMNDEHSEISKLFRNERSYVMLEEYNVQPSVKYLTQIRNVDEKIAGDHVAPKGEHGHDAVKHEAAEQHS